MKKEAAPKPQERAPPGARPWNGNSPRPGWPERSDRGMAGVKQSPSGPVTWDRGPRGTSREICGCWRPQVRVQEEGMGQWQTDSPCPPHWPSGDSPPLQLPLHTLCGVPSGPHPRSVLSSLYTAPRRAHPLPGPPVTCLCTYPEHLPQCRFLCRAHPISQPPEPLSPPA